MKCGWGSDALLGVLLTVTGAGTGTGIAAAAPGDAGAAGLPHLAGATSATPVFGFVDWQLLPNKCCFRCYSPLRLILCAALI